MASAATSASATSITSVLRIGAAPGSGDQATLLKSALLHYFSTKTSADDAPGEDPTSTDTISNPDVLTLSNKYFTANILIAGLGVDIEENDADDTQQSQYKEDGVILLFDALQCNPDLTNGSSFEELDSVHLPDAGDLLRLCMGITLGDWSDTELRGTKDSEGEYSKRILWCLDRGYEYADKVDLSADGQLLGHDERDKEGFARIIEAIQGTVWSSAVMKKREAPKAVVPIVVDEKKREDDTAAAAAYEPPNLDLNPSLAIPDPTTSDDYIDEPATDQEAEVRASAKQEETAFHRLEGVMKEATRIREMSRQGELQDDDRRKRAADAATLMMGLMDQMGLNDEDDESDDSDDEAGN